MYFLFLVINLRCENENKSDVRYPTNEFRGKLNLVMIIGVICMTTIMNACMIYY